jgi:hypothetical protein
MITPDRIKNVDTLTKFIQYGIIHLNNAACFYSVGQSPARAGCFQSEHQANT